MTDIPFSRRAWLHRSAVLAALALAGRPVVSRASAGVRDGRWRDAVRQRELPWRLRLQGGAGPWPWALYSHGLGGSREGGDAWGEAWRAAGIAVLHLQHPGSDAAALRAGPGAVRAAASGEQLVARVQDMRFAIDEVARRAGEGEAPWQALRADALGVAGHSFGALTSQALAGQRYRWTGTLADERPRAFIALSPSPARDGGLTIGEQFGGVTRPFLAVTGSLDGDPFGRYDTGAARASVYDGLPPGRRALLWLEGADHMSFGGNAARPIRGRRSGPLARGAQAEQLEPAHQALVARISTLWWRAELAGDAAAQAALAARAGLADGDRWRRD